MKRMHVHVAVNDLDMAIGFYSALFAARPSVVKSDYAKWMLDDPRVNFAISMRGEKVGLNHLGIQVESETELAFFSSDNSRVSMLGMPRAARASSSQG